MHVCRAQSCRASSGASTDGVQGAGVDLFVHVKMDGAQAALL